MSKTDPEHRLLLLVLQHSLDVADGLGTHDRVPGTVAQEQPVKVVDVQRMIPGHEVYASASLKEATQLVVLEATVHGADPGAALRVVRDRGLQIEAVIVMKIVYLKIITFLDLSTLTTVVK